MSPDAPLLALIPEIPDVPTALLAQVAQAEPVAYGPYLAWWKIAILLVIFLAWFRLLLWVDKDSEDARLPREGINSGLWAAVVLAAVLAVVLPFFLLSLVAVLAIFGASFGGYLIWRKQVVGLEDIPDQLSGFFTGLVTFGKKTGPSKKKEEDVALGAVTLMDARGNVPPAPDTDEPARPGYETAHRVLNDPLYKGAERITFVQLAGKGGAAGGERYATKYTVDGFDYPGAAFDPDSAESAMVYLKALAGLDADERRKVQNGQLQARTANGTHKLAVTTSGSRTGESMVFEVNPNKRYADRATALGFTQGQREAIAASVADNSGVVLLGAPAGGGLDALVYGFIREHDAFTQHILTLERNKRLDLEGVTQQDLPVTADAAEEQKALSWIADQEPNVLIVDRLVGRGGAQEVLRLARAERRRAYVGMRANDTAEAVAQWIKLVGDPKAALAPLNLVVVGRILRKLCESCKIPYEPGEAVLAKMGAPKGKIKTLFKARTEPMLDQRGNPVPCEFCGQLGYSGRIGAFEVLIVDDAVRQALRQDASPQAVRNLLRQQKMPTINEAALRQVMAGRTDLQEVQRIMSGSGSGGGGGGGSSSGKMASPAKPPRQPAPAAS